MPSISHTSQLRRVEPHHERSKRVWRPTALSRDHDCCTRYQVLCIHVSSIHVCIHILGSGESVLGSNLVPVHHTKVRNATHENQTNATRYRCISLSTERNTCRGPNECNEMRFPTRPYSCPRTCCLRFQTPVLWYNCQTPSYYCTFNINNCTYFKQYHFMLDVFAPYRRPAVLLVACSRYLLPREESTGVCVSFRTPSWGVPNAYSQFVYRLINRYHPTLTLTRTRTRTLGSE